MGSWPSKHKLMYNVDTYPPSIINFIGVVMVRVVMVRVVMVRVVMVRVVMVRVVARIC